MFAPGAIKLSSLDEAQLWVLKEIFDAGQTVAPRGMRTTEIIGASFTIRNPRRRCVTNSARKWSIPLAIGEFCWHLCGSDDLSFISYYAPRWRQFSDDGHRVLGSCYGKRIFSQDNKNYTQWDQLLQLLRSDPMTRRAVLTFHEASYFALSADSKDVACATIMQFFIRDNKLDAIVYMRSNDAILGLPYDIFLFTMIQELLANTLCVELGEYHHIAGSLHLYEHQYALGEKMLRNRAVPEFEMPQ